ncbi:MAG: DUF1801 domain-containing protein [Calditrichaeota bacterium]|nr:DUF1801 domain-containing protein [Calditrichota bacterium]
MSKNKTTENSSSVADFVSAVKSDVKREDSRTLMKLMKKMSGFDAKMWGPSIIGFGSYHYKYESGREGDMPLLGFSPRSSALVLYLSSNFKDRDKLLNKLGKHKTGKGCIYINKLNDVKMDVLEEMITKHLDHMKAK